MAISNLAMRPTEIEMITAVNAMQRAVEPLYPEISKRQPMRPAEIELLESVNILRDKFKLLLGYLSIYGKSVQDGIPTPETPMPIESIETLTVSTSEWSEPIDLQGHQLRSLPDGTHDSLTLTYLRPSTREGWSWYRREMTTYVGECALNGSETWYTGGNSYNGMIGTNRYTHISGITSTPAATKDILSPQIRATNVAMWSDPDHHIWECTHNFYQTHVSFDNATVGITAETDPNDRTAAIRAWLADNPITIYYPLEAPSAEVMSQIELPDISNVADIHLDANDDIVVEYDYDYVIRRIIVNG